MTRSERDAAASERDRLKELHTQVKSALQESYSREKGSMKQVCCRWCALAPSLCALKLAGWSLICHHLRRRRHQTSASNHPIDRLTV